MYAYNIDYSTYEYSDVSSPIQALSDVQTVGVVYADLQAVSFGVAFGTMAFAGAVQMLYWTRTTKLFEVLEERGSLENALEQDYNIKGFTFDIIHTKIALNINFLTFSMN